MADIRLNQGKTQAASLTNRRIPCNNWPAGVLTGDDEYIDPNTQLVKAGSNVVASHSTPDNLGALSGTVVIDLTARNSFKATTSGVVTLQTTSQTTQEGQVFILRITASGNAITLDPAFFIAQDQSINIDTNNGVVNQITGISNGTK